MTCTVVGDPVNMCKWPDNSKNEVLRSSTTDTNTQIRRHTRTCGRTVPKHKHAPRRGQVHFAGAGFDVVAVPPLCDREGQPGRGTSRLLFRGSSTRCASSRHGVGGHRCGGAADRRSMRRCTGSPKNNNTHTDKVTQTRNNGSTALPKTTSPSSTQERFTTKTDSKHSQTNDTNKTKTTTTNSPSAPCNMAAVSAAVALLSSPTASDFSRSEACSRLAALCANDPAAVHSAVALLAPLTAADAWRSRTAAAAALHAVTAASRHALLTVDGCQRRLDVGVLTFDGFDVATVLEKGRTLLSGGMPVRDTHHTHTVLHACLSFFFISLLLCVVGVLTLWVHARGGGLPVSMHAPMLLFVCC